MISITQLMDPDDIVAEIRMERQAFPGAFMLVEGVTDVRRFEQFIDTLSASMVNCWGKTKLVTIVRKLNDIRFSGFIALADADFDRETGSMVELENLIYSENHDYDIDLMKTNVILRYLMEMANIKLCEEFGGVPSISEKIVQGLQPLSSAKLANVKGHINVKFAEINWLPAFDGLQINRERLAYIILRKNNPDRDKIVEFIQLIDSEYTADIWQITNGHDFAEALGACLRLRISSRKMPQTSGDEIERHLRLAISEAEFKTMDVYRKIIEWQTASKSQILRTDLL